MKKINRKPNRLDWHDYSEQGYYFVTICTKNRKKYFGEIKNGIMILNDIGKIAEQQLLWLKKQYKYINIDEYIIMPNHVHVIIVIIEINNVGTSRDLSLPDKKIKSLSEIIGAFKTTSSKIIHINHLKSFQWQRSFYDHIIRDENDLGNIRQYILNNPLQWEYDRNNPNNII